MQKLSEPGAPTRRGMTIAAITVIGVAFAGAAYAGVAFGPPRAYEFATMRAQGHAATNSYDNRLAAQATQPMVQDDTPTDDDDKEPTPAQVQKYIDVYKSMQKDRNLTIEQATNKQGMTVAEFRKLEGQIERQDTIRERVRKALRNDSGKESDSD